MALKTSHSVVILLFILFVFISAVQITIVAMTKHMHGILAMVATFIMGTSLFTFRVLRGISTRKVKYIHALFGLLACGAYSVSLVRASLKFTYDTVHGTPCYIALVSFLLQLLLGLLLFTYLYENRKVRYYFAPVHDIFGLWVYMELVGCCSVGLHLIDNDETKINYSPKTMAYIVATVLNFLLTTVVVLSPFFEWELIGYI